MGTTEHEALRFFFILNKGAKSRDIFYFIMFHSAHPKNSYVQKDSSLSISLHVIDVTYSDFFCDNKCLFFVKLNIFFIFVT